MEKEIKSIDANTFNLDKNLALYHRTPERRQRYFFGKMNFINNIEKWKY